jgi:hypothetical protein
MMFKTGDMLVYTGVGDRFIALDDVILVIMTERDGRFMSVLVRGHIEHNWRADEQIWATDLIRIE